MNKMISTWLLLGIAGAACLAPAAAYAQSAVFPDKPVQLVVPFAPGGATDSLARLVGQKLSERWGQPVVIDNRSGATGAIGSQAVARARPDGYTLLLGTASTHSVAPAVNPRLPYQLKEFAPISLIATFPNLLVVHPSLPATTVPELIKLLKANPGKYNFGSTGTGGSVHLTGELFKIATGTDMVHVPFKGSGPAVTELLSGRVEIAFDNIPPMLPYVQSGRLRALAVTGNTRLSLLPNIPTVAETIPGFEAGIWVGFFAPAGTPPEVVNKIAADVAAVMQQPDIKKTLFEQGSTAVGNTPAEFGKFVASEVEKWRRVVKTAGVVVE